MSSAALVHAASQFAARTFIASCETVDIAWGGFRTVMELGEQRTRSHLQTRTWGDSTDRQQTSTVLGLTLPPLAS